MLILLVEDEKELAELVLDYLEEEGIEGDYASDGAMAWSLLQANQYDAIVLDVSMPRMDGFSLATKLKEARIATPVIFVTAKDTLQDKLTGFELGAQDYMTKPFELAELVARLRVLASRVQAQSKHFQLDTLSVDFDAREVSRSDRSLSLSASQWQLLELLARHSPKLVTKDGILQAVWPGQDASSDRYKNLLSRLRSQIDIQGEKPLLHTHRGLGVALKLKET